MAYNIRQAIAEAPSELKWARLIEMTDTHSFDAVVCKQVVNWLRDGDLVALADYAQYREETGYNAWHPQTSRYHRVCVQFAYKTALESTRVANYRLWASTAMCIGSYQDDLSALLALAKNPIWVDWAIDILADSREFGHINAIISSEDAPLAQLMVAVYAESRYLSKSAIKTFIERYAREVGHDGHCLVLMAEFYPEFPLTDDFEILQVAGEGAVSADIVHQARLIRESASSSSGEQLGRLLANCPPSAAEYALKYVPVGSDVIWVCLDHGAQLSSYHQRHLMLDYTLLRSARSLIISPDVLGNPDYIANYRPEHLNELMEALPPQLLDDLLKNAKREPACKRAT